MPSNLFRYQGRLPAVGDTCENGRTLCYVIRLGIPRPDEVPNGKESSTPTWWEPPFCPAVKLSPRQDETLHELLAIVASISSGEGRINSEGKNWHEQLDQVFLNFSMLLITQTLSLRAISQSLDELPCSNRIG